METSLPGDLCLQSSEGQPHLGLLHFLLIILNCCSSFLQVCLLPLFSWWLQTSLDFNNVVIVSLAEIQAVLDSLSYHRAQEVSHFFGQSTIACSTCGALTLCIFFIIPSCNLLFLGNSVNGLAQLFLLVDLANIWLLSQRRQQLAIQMMPYRQLQSLINRTSLFAFAIEQEDFPPPARLYR